MGSTLMLTSISLFFFIVFDLFFLSILLSSFIIFDVVMSDCLKSFSFIISLEVSFVALIVDIVESKIIKVNDNKNICKYFLSYLTLKI